MNVVFDCGKDPSFVDVTPTIGEFRTGRETTNGVEVSRHLPPDMECQWGPCQQNLCRNWSFRRGQIKG